MPIGYYNSLGAVEPVIVGGARVQRPRGGGGAPRERGGRRGGVDPTAPVVAYAGESRVFVDRGPGQRTRRFVPGSRRDPRRQRRFDGDVFFDDFVGPDFIPVPFPVVDYIPVPTPGLYSPEIENPVFIQESAPVSGPRFQESALASPRFAQRPGRRREGRGMLVSGLIGGGLAALAIAALMGRR